ncbi:hypothetical protein TPHA_0N00660 [Tetrapisispora phaffii CBS 4417]|uniref:Partial AB-hydrolase lipase domain-containing protein n=1 Tax=Tetrapisispora phaffii (strain ATCC 24235 / CBS 4417 / NBRC 1672 / NRRL Y-8282 / UCD 70-5) TaxID=1071381 RepID=G8C119_TETPH|nr:hypothetical protein TPHA_0N00660 [Tetrapisispora phaffii CBS 4417]CCE65847.1 hypothetical protein TPHA_0N00660 [Tetrapisispora phaffii CBS 4417]
MYAFIYMWLWPPPLTGKASMWDTVSDIGIWIISTIVINFSLMVLFICSLYHHYIGKFFAGPRDVRGSDTTIKEDIADGQDDGMRHGASRHTRNASTSTTSPLNPNPNVIEEDLDNNIEYDHTVTNMAANPFVNGNEDLRLVASLNYYYNQVNIKIRELEVETDDGFILDLWHMEGCSGDHDIEANTGTRPVILLLHGLLQSCGSFASGGKRSLAYFFYEQGFDVWLGNNRCGLEKKYNRKKISSDKLWDWDIKHMAFLDLKCLVTNVLSNTGAEKLTLIGHSQGTTQTFYSLINHNEFNDFKLSEKLHNFVALAPAIYPGPLFKEKVFVRLMRKTIDSPLVFGKKSFMPIMMDMRNLLVGTKIFSFLSFVMFNFLFDWNDLLWDPSLRNRHFLFSPVHISVKLMQWWLSPDPNALSFANGYRSIFQTDRQWFPTSDDIDVNEIEKIDKAEPYYPKILLFVPKQDRLVDGKKLINHFIEYENAKMYKIWYIDEYSHLDTLWAEDVIERIGVPLVESLRLGL